MKVKLYQNIFPHSAYFSRPINKKFLRECFYRFTMADSLQLEYWEINFRILQSRLFQNA